MDTLIGIPIDCTGKFTGVERMPATLRAAGLVERLNMEDRGDLPVQIDDPNRDPTTGIIGFQAVCVASSTIRTEIGNLLKEGRKPLVIGGCCTLLVGVFAALKDVYGRVGLAFVDGHLDFYDGKSSPTGEAADMDLAMLTGHGPAGLIDLAGMPPLVSPSDVIVMGFRDAQEAAKDGAPDPMQVAPELTLYDVKKVKKRSPALVAMQSVGNFTANAGKFWLHFDLDVLDETVMPAVDYKMSGGLNWDEAVALVKPLAASPACVGMDVTIYNPTLDPDGTYAKEIVARLGEILGA